MGFKKVYKILQEIFPQVDSRALRAVAIEHQKDADTAVEAVVNEVIPFLAERSVISSSSTKNELIAVSPKATEVFASGPSSSNTVLVENVKYQEEEHNGPFFDAKAEQMETFHDANLGFHQIHLENRPDKLASVNESDERTVTVGATADMISHISYVELVHENGLNAVPDKVLGDYSTEETPYKESQESSIQFGCYQVSSLEHGGLHDNQRSDFCQESESVHTKRCEENAIVEETTVGHLPSSNSEPFSLTSPVIQISDLEKELSGPIDTALGTEAFAEMVHVEGDSVLNTVVTRSGQVCSTDLLEDFIADARNNKKYLLSAAEIVVSLMKEVELQEKDAEQAKEDAVNGGLYIFRRVEDLKQMLQHAKEANDMHAGEVYGEKAILATEVRELQSRLLSLSDERDKTLKIFEEMRESLEVRLAESEKAIKAAKKEKLERRHMALKALKHQEAVMEKVVQEANVLKQEAEANAKLREFLIDRGRAVDTLQGEIYVICSDMRLLKENFDNRVPLSKSITSNQTSCLLASSSSSSSKSVICEEVHKVTRDAADQSNFSDNDADLPELDGQYADWKSFFDDPKFV